MTSPTSVAFAHAITVARLEGGISQAELALRAGMSGSSLSQRLSGRRPITTNDIDRLADALGIDPFDLMETLPRYRNTFLNVWRITNVIREMMRKARISQGQMAEATGIPIVTLNRRLNRRGREWLVPELAAVAEVLGTTLTGLVERAERRPADDQTQPTDWRQALTEVLA